MQDILTKLKEKANSHHTRVVAFAISGLIIGAALTFFSMPQVTVAPDPGITADTASTSVTVETITADPMKIRIPSVNIEADFEGPVGLNKDQTIGVPDSYEEVGWYMYGPKPGELGPAVVLGHVDSYQGPAVFYALGQTEVGDTVEIEREDGSVATFEITRLDRRSQSDFPTAEVYGDIDYAGLRLITCTGTYDHGTLRYSHNLIVYAKLTEDTGSNEEIAE